MLGRKTRAKIGNFFFYVLVTIIFVYSVFPFYWAINSSLKSGTEIFSLSAWPLAPAWQNYSAVFSEQPFGKNILNSVLVATSTVVLSLAIGIFCAFSLARRHFLGRRLLLAVILCVSMFPQIAVLAGMFELIRWLGLYNHWLGLTLSYMILTLPFTIWTLTTFLRDVPRALEEAAVMDGASSWVIVTKIFIPLSAPALVTTGLLAFIVAWNEFLFALTLTLSDEAKTVPVAIAFLSGASQFEIPWGNIMAASVIVTVPLVLLVLVFQRRIVAGLTAGSLKG